MISFVIVMFFYIVFTLGCFKFNPDNMSFVEKNKSVLNPFVYKPLSQGMIHYS